MSLTVLKYLDECSFCKEHRDSVDKIKEYFAQRLYYELSEFVMQFLLDVESEMHNYRQFYDIFVLDFSKRINPVSLARIAIMIAVQIKKNNVDEAIEFMTMNLGRAPLADDKFSSNLCRVYLAKLRLYKGQIVPAHDTLMNMRQEIDSFNNLTLLHLFFYDAILYYHYLKNDYYAYNSDVLKYFGATAKIEVKIDDDGVNKPLFCVISTLMSPYATNVEEVLYQSQVRALISEQQYCWFDQLLKAVLHGDVSGLAEIMPHIESHEILSKSVTLVREKTVLMNILNVAFNCIVSGTKMTFSLISESSGIPIDSVENFLIRAFSLNIIEGSIDQVNQVVNLTWVKPKFITESRLPCLQDQIATWDRKIIGLVDHIKPLSVNLNSTRQASKQCA
ncbi:26S proteasome non-ATPase regulatory subunit 13 [Thelohanellus kitauei]|uniref:26S proteasome non-ATPase regulatory subunit 13 n=1 Tax=Thelohanellus kitauei TaxID=669202 RepID=A0A0C2J149_THEKT|nr:26S proteasome non-ATPase regulatory subunit 13 [Thelohanellus kitauei]